RVVPYKRIEFGDISLGFARKADDERRSERDAGDGRANVVEQAIVLLSGAWPFHPLQHRVRRMLQRQVDVLADVLAFRHRRQRLVVNRGGGEGEQAGPFEAGDGGGPSWQPGPGAAAGSG